MKAFVLINIIAVILMWRLTSISDRRQGGEQTLDLVIPIVAIGAITIIYDAVFLVSRLFHWMVS